MTPVSVASYSNVRHDHVWVTLPERNCCPKAGCPYSFFSFSIFSFYFFRPTKIHSAFSPSGRGGCYLLVPKWSSTSWATILIFTLALCIIFLLELLEARYFPACQSFSWWLNWCILIGLSENRFKLSSWAKRLLSSLGMQLYISQLTRDCTTKSYLLDAVWIILFFICVRFWHSVLALQSSWRWFIQKSSKCCNFGVS